MKLRRVAGTATLAIGLGVAGLLGTGVGTAGAEPGPQCGPQPGACDQHPGQGPGQGGPDFDHRGIDDARRDHQPFNYNGQRVNPVWDDNHHGWGFWFLGLWIPL